MITKTMPQMRCAASFPANAGVKVRFRAVRPGSCSYARLRSVTD